MGDKSFIMGITGRRWTGYVFVWLAILFLFAFLYVMARRVVINEIRHQAVGVAIATAAAFDSKDLESIRGPEDASGEAYQRIQAFLHRVAVENPDIRYIYVMRRAVRNDAAPTDYEYVVDGRPRDANGNGKIDPDEICEPIGKLYRAANLPELFNAWYRPGADRAVSPDPPYPALMSGYAPIRNARGQTVAVAGVDITAKTVRTKLATLQGVMLLVWLTVILLITMVVQLYYQQNEALGQIKKLSGDLAIHNDLLRAANTELADRNEQYKKELKLAQTLQVRLLPGHFPKKDKLHFEKYYLTSDLPGGDFFDVFSLDDDHVAVYMADVAGRGVSTALISGLLKSVFSTVLDRQARDTVHFYTDLWNPASVLTALNDLLLREIPEYEFITMIYAVLDIPHNRMLISRAGHPSPIHFEKLNGQAVSWDIPTGAALGLLSDRQYTVTEKIVSAEDKILFHTDGLPGTLNNKGEPFGEARLLDLVRQNGAQTTTELIASVRKAVEEHRGGFAITDDFSILVIEIV